MDVFESCSKINELLAAGQDFRARDSLIRLLDHLEMHRLPYDAIVNKMIRQTGLFPYLRTETATWEDRVAFDAFKVDIGLRTPVTLHREQSNVLRRLLNGENLAVSAPTSFGKSFIIDAFISIRKPKNVAIVVPTLALTDETRRRLQQKFGRQYQIVTTSDATPSEQNLFVFPQERALSYIGKLTELDLLVVDEFYKASPKFDKERSASLLRAIMELGAIAKQRYFLAPNIAGLTDALFTTGMQFTSIPFNTVYLEKHELYKTIGRDEAKKNEFLVDLLRKAPGKTLIYAASYANIDRISNLLIDKLPAAASPKLHHFEDWLSLHYGSNWQLPKLVKRGVGVHNGQLHRPLSQIQVRLFEEADGLHSLISTSSIIEGVNTSAENVVLWSNRKGGRGNPKLDDFTYRNIIGRGGRMFRHFVGKIYVLEEPPAASETQLDLSLSDEILGSVDESRYAKQLTQAQVARIATYKQEMRSMLGTEAYADLIAGKKLQTSDSTVVKKLVQAIAADLQKWNGLGFLNSDDRNQWDRLLYAAIYLRPDIWGVQFRKIVAFIKVLSMNWTRSIPELLEDLGEADVTMDSFFKLERNVTYMLTALLSDTCLIYRALSESTVDISPFLSKLSNAFLPPLVFSLEEYGLPRMLSKRIVQAGILDLTSRDITLRQCIDAFLNIGLERLKARLRPDDFDAYILQYFFDGLTCEDIPLPARTGT